MNKDFELTDTQAYWFVGSIYDGKDHTERFIEDGVWELNPEAKPIGSIKSIKAGERIAIKSSYIRKNGLLFDNRGHAVSVMAIKAIGTVIENLGDGKNLKVDWEADSTLREWYFFTNRNTVWKVVPETAIRAGLIDFAFHGKAQDIDMFRNDPYWRERFGDNAKENSSFDWTNFYEEMASKLLTFRDRRDELIAGIHKISEKSDVMSILNDQYEKGVEGGLLKDICPFTVMAMFNRGITDDNRKIIAKELADLLGVSQPVPESFDGIPIVNNQKTWFFGYSYKRQPDDIDNLWDVFARAISFTDLDNEGEGEDTRSEFIAAYDKATQCYGVGWNLTMGLYWIRPWRFLTLDGQSQKYINKKLNIEISMNGLKGRCTANDYLELLDNLDIRFQENSYPVHSFPELSLAAYRYPSSDNSDDSEKSWLNILRSKIKKICSETLSNEFTRQEFLSRFSSDLETKFPNNKEVGQTVSQQFQKLRDKNELKFITSGRYRWLGSDFDFEEEAFEQDFNVEEDQMFELLPERYSVNDIISDGCFLSQKKIEVILKRLQAKKNIILQGPPGTGKTWLAKKLAFALIGQRDDSKVKAVQFHPNLSYEDFIRGWRPSGEGKLTLVDGPFMKMIDNALKDPDSKHVIVIEEINRGNPAQVFGEMLTLLETDKRAPDEALELSYKRESGERIYIPSNLYVIGTMNIADRSLALVDLALRRRFAFIDLQPTLGKAWHDWVQDKNGINLEFLYDIEKRLNTLNEKISTDPSLGAQFQVGHSYVTPAVGMDIIDAKEWFGEVVETEIGPLLDEYWFDDLDKSRKAQKCLIEGL